MQISEPEKNYSKVKNFSLFSLGFRVFFLFAGLFSVISMTTWFVIFQFQFPIVFSQLSSSQWHAHEMIYGYSLAVIAGFLLTAIKNWTGVQTPTGKTLALIFSFWLIARVLFVFGDQYSVLATSFDILFNIALLLAAIFPVIKVKQWSQSIILLVLLLFVIFNFLFYLGLSGILDNGIFMGLYGGLYIVIGLILIMGRRVIPFFIERGVNDDVKLYNSKWLDIVILILFVLFIISSVFLNVAHLTAYSAIGLFVANIIRLTGWYTKGIWQKSMLWSIYLACWFICFGFLLVALNYYFGLSKYLAIHAFTVGGIGLITMGMMSRVALGHTGRDVSQPPRVISYALAILVISVIIRVLFPIFDTSNYTLWISLSQLLWIVAFIIFTVTYLPILYKPRIDNQPG